jgi:tRNA-2-methylthio-N6-dimethylallyladenosine synthase
LELKRKSRYYIQTFGCQMNVNDSEKVAGLLEAEGYEPAEGPEDADFVFVNTCAVREKATSKLRHALGRLRRLRSQRPALRIGVGGCVAQLEREALLTRRSGIDLLVGTHNFRRVPELLGQVERRGAPVVELDRAEDAFAVPSTAVAHGSPVRAFVTAMEGCNHVCSFCVVPRTRGPEVNRPADAIVAEVESLVGRGYSEVMLLGQTVNAYRDGNADFAALLERVDAVPGLRRLRFTTSHPEHVGERMAEALRSLPQVCPYLHLPFQSGSDRVLTSMRRGYTRQAYLDTVALLRDRVPDLALSTDVIAGYPGETEHEFEQTLSVLERVGFESVFAFAYSARPGTTALRLADDVPEAEKRRRVTRLNAIQQDAQRRRNEARVGSVEEVLIDSVDSPPRVSGRTRHYRIVHLDGGPELVGRLVQVEITGAGPNSFVGRPAQPIH